MFSVSAVTLTPCSSNEVWKWYQTCSGVCNNTDTACRAVINAQVFKRASRGSEKCVRKLRPVQAWKMLGKCKIVQQVSVTPLFLCLRLTGTSYCTNHKITWSTCKFPTKKPVHWYNGTKRQPAKYLKCEGRLIWLSALIKWIQRQSLRYWSNIWPCAKSCLIFHLHNSDA